MKNCIDFQTRNGLYRLEAVLPGVVRCVHTKAAAIAAPSMLIQAPELPEGIGAFADCGQDAGRVWLHSGGLLAEYDRATDRLTWRAAKTGEILHDTTSCSMCRRMIINAGIQKVIARVGENEFTVTNVRDWIFNDNTLPPGVV